MWLASSFHEELFDEVPRHQILDMHREFVRHHDGNVAKRHDSCEIFKVIFRLVFKNMFEVQVM